MYSYFLFHTWKPGTVIKVAQLVKATADLSFPSRRDAGPLSLRHFNGAALV